MSNQQLTIEQENELLQRALRLLSEDDSSDDPVTSPATSPATGKKKSKVKTAERDSKPQLGWIAAAVGVLIMFAWAGSQLFHFGTDGDAFKPPSAQTAVAEAIGITPVPDDVVVADMRSVFAQDAITPTVQGDMLSEMLTKAANWDIAQSAPMDESTPIPDPVVLEPTATVTPIVQIEYVRDTVEIEVTRVVTVEVVAAAVPPTPTPVMLWGTAKICIYGEGLTGIYLDGVGLSGNSCYDLRLSGSPSSTFNLVVTK